MQNETLRQTHPVRSVDLRAERKKEREGGTLSWWRSQRQLEIDAQKFFKQSGYDSHLGNGVASVGDNA